MTDYREMAQAVKQASYRLAALPEDVRNGALLRIAEELRSHAEEIFAENEKDLAAAEQLPAPVRGRLRFGEHKLGDVIAGLADVAALSDPIGNKLLKRELDAGLILTKVTCPIGVIGVIFESRPDALVQISSLGIKSGNGIILKGGSEARNTNRILFDVIYRAGTAAGLPESFAALIEERAGIDEIIRMNDAIDLLIPRGSNAFVRYIMEHSEIPVMGHAAGLCHVYVDRAADLSKAVPLILDAKTQYVSACNAAETLLLHEEIADAVMEALLAASDGRVEYIPEEDADGFPEYLDYKMTVKRVASVDEAIGHINRYSSHHTDCIVTEDEAAAEAFLSGVDSAGVYWNASTRFADGFRYGFGAEVGISTGKLPPRGPVGLDGLVTYKYLLKGDGHMVGDYAEGRRTFHFRDLL